MGVRRHICHYACYLECLLCSSSTKGEYLSNRIFFSEVAVCSCFRDNYRMRTCKLPRILTPNNGEIE